MTRLVAALMLLTSCTHARFAERTEATRAALKIPSLSVAVVDDGKTVHSRGGDTLYPIGSITKTFTSTLMLQLAEEGRLDLDARVADFVDWEVAPDIRIRHVLSHTSEGTPGARFVYSSRFNWLDNVVEAATKEKFRDLLMSRVLKSAALASTFPGEESLSEHAPPHRIDGSGAVVPSKLPPLALHSSSGLSATVNDLARYSIAIDDGKLLSPAARERAFAPTVSTSGKPTPYGLGWFTQVVSGERVVWHTSWWPDAYSGLLVKVPSRKLTLVLLANTDTLVSPQGGASNVLLYPIANDFLKTFLGGNGPFRGTALVAESLTERARNNTARADDLVREALRCCPADLDVIADADRLRLFAQSSDASIRAVAIDAAQRLTTEFPDDLAIRFDTGMLYGRIRPTLRINGDDAPLALAALTHVVESSQPKPKWMDAWSNYLVAENIADRDPQRAKELAARALATNVDTDGLRARVEELLKRLP